jgi:translation elongation factor EF-4
VTSRAAFETMDYLDPQRVLLKYKIPLAEVLIVSTTS